MTVHVQSRYMTVLVKWYELHTTIFSYSVQCMGRRNGEERWGGGMERRDSVHVLCKIVCLHVIM